MSNMNGKEIKLWTPLVLNEHGIFCCLCQRTPKAKTPELFVPRLLIHEIKYERPLKLENMRPICDSCNQKIHPEKQEKFNKKDMKPELAINRAKEGPFRSYVVNRILLDTSEDYNKLVNAACEKVGCSTKAGDTYMDKLCSDEGRLLEMFGTVYMRGYEPEMKFEIMSNSWVTVTPAKSIPESVVKAIQQEIAIVERV